MRAVLQRVRHSSVTIDQTVTGEIDTGLLVLLGVTESDDASVCDFLADKVLNLRIFEDETGKMNRSVIDVHGSVLIVSQFTLYADCRKGRRPSFTQAAKPDHAIPLYERFISKIKEAGVPTATGQFGADMQVLIENDGPVTILLDTDEIMPAAKQTQT